MVETNTYIIISIVVAILAVALGAAYTTGNLNPLFEWVGVYYFKAKAKAEEKKMEAEGQKEGEDFLKSELKGNQQAGELQQNLEDISNIKKGLL
jgi:hypothetical protein